MESEADDLELISRIRGGAAQLFARLVDRYEQRVFAAVYSMVRNRQDAEDVAQDVFLTAFRRLETFEGRCSFFTWLRRIAFNLCIDHHRKRAHRSGLTIADLGDVSSDRETEPGDQAMMQETVALVRGAIDRLADEQRSIIIMRDIEGLDYSEIATILEIPIGTVRSRLHRARLELRQILEISGIDSIQDRKGG